LRQSVNDTYEYYDAVKFKFSIISRHRKKNRISKYSKQGNIDLNGNSSSGSAVKDGCWVFSTDVLQNTRIIIILNLSPPEPELVTI